MAKAAADAAPEPTHRLRLPPGKGSELVGLAEGALGLVLLISLISHFPLDQSLLFRSTASLDTGARNLIGPVGANLSALAFGLVGLVSFLVPVFLLAAAWRRLRGRSPEGATLRMIGAAVVIFTLPALLDATVGTVPWRGAALAAGGAVGQVFASFLEARLNLTGTLVVLGATVAMGSALAVQTTLGDVCRLWLARLSDAWTRFKLGRERRHERREKESARRRVVAKHLQRVIEEKERAPGAATLEAGDAPGRVVERRGQGRFTVRKVAAAVLADPQVTAVEPTRPVITARPATVVPPRPAPPRSEPFQYPTGPPPSLAADLPESPPRQLALGVETTARPQSLPPLDLLQSGTIGTEINENELVRRGELIRLRCAEFGVVGTIEGINPGPVITVYEFQPAPGVKVSQIVNLQDELALGLKAASVRIDRIPGRSTLGIEVPNEERVIIRLGSLLQNEAFQKSRSPLTMAIGVNLHGEPYFADLAQMPHLLVAGATGAGKSVGLQTMITSILYKATADEVRFIFIDPKRIELGVYSDIPNLETKVVTEPQQAANVLNNMVVEMERRYKLLAEVHVRSIAYYNSAIRDPEQRKRLALDEEGGREFSADDLQPLPYFVIIIDELADLMMVASSDVETAIARLAQMARAVGIHLIVATQRPSVDVLTGVIKANFPCRIAYATATRHDSRVILDQVGAEQLLGKGDALFMPPGSARITRLHGAYVSEQETAGMVRWLKRQAKPEYNLDLLKNPEGDRGKKGGGGDEDDVDDDLYDEASRLVVSERMGSASFLQRRLRVGFSRAARLIDLMEQDGLLGPPQGSKPREVLVPPDYFREIDNRQE
ncbi:MAG: DNA translocase FtsK [Thermoanaerobaculia bacterium]|nr:DNA translocase FtsK [Thermoanaerobaculia bacterium]